MVLFSEQADVSVRPAIPSDAPDFARIQLAAWQVSHADALGADILAALDVDAVAEQWRTTVATPPGQEFAVFTALVRDEVVGFCAVSPGQIVALEVHPNYQRQGHGSRLLSASVDRIRQAGATTISTWILSDNQGRKDFFGSAGMAFDSRVRTLAIAEDRTTQEERWSAEL